MSLARAAGYPVPRAEALSESEMLLERVAGPTMAEDLGRRPWRLWSHAATLASLHDRLHAIAAPQWLEEAPFGQGPALLHLDLHPANVLLSSHGPVVIDWPNARRGPPEVDVAMSWIIMATSDLDDLPRRQLIALARSLFVAAFLRHFDGDAVRRALRVVGEARMRDANVRERERARVRRLVDLT